MRSFCKKAPVLNCWNIYGKNKESRRAALNKLENMRLLCWWHEKLFIVHKINFRLLVRHR